MSLKSLKADVNAAQIAAADVELRLLNINNSLAQYTSYAQKEHALQLIRDYAIMFENNPPVENTEVRLSIPIEWVLGNEYFSRINAVFTSVGKSFTLYCNGIVA